MINIKSHIAWQIKQEKALEGELKKIHSTLGKAKRSDLELLKSIIKLAQEYPTKDSVLLTFLDFLQLADTDSLLEEFDLKDIDRLFKHLCKFNPFNYEINFEYYCFLDNVLNEEKKAKKMRELFIQKMSTKFKIKCSN